MKLFELNELQPFETSTTGMPEYDKRLNTETLRWMSPDAYINLCIDGFRSKGFPRALSLVALRDKKKWEHYAKLMKQGVQFPTLMIRYQDHAFKQQGLHRALAAKRIGVTRLPVLVLDDRNDNETL